MSKARPASGEAIQVYLFACPALSVKSQKDLQGKFLFLRFWLRRGSLTAGFKSDSHLYMRNDDEVPLERGDSQFGTVRWMFSAPLRAPLTPQIPSAMNHSGLTHRPIWWNACACGWGGPGAKVAAGRWMIVAWWGKQVDFFCFSSRCLYLPLIPS